MLTVRAKCIALMHLATYHGTLVCRYEHDDMTRNLSKLTIKYMQLYKIKNLFVTKKYLPLLEEINQTLSLLQIVEDSMRLVQF